MITTIIRMSKFFVTEHKVRENGEKSSPGSTLHFIMGNKETILFIWLWFSNLECVKTRCQGAMQSSL